MSRYIRHATRTPAERSLRIVEEIEAMEAKVAPRPPCRCAVCELARAMSLRRVLMVDWWRCRKGRD